MPDDAPLNATSREMAEPVSRPATILPPPLPAMPATWAPPPPAFVAARNEIASSKPTVRPPGKRWTWRCDECGKSYGDKSVARAMREGCVAGCSGLDINEAAP